MAESDFRARLQRLRPPKPAPAAPLPADPAAAGLPGGEHLTPRGALQLIEARYPLEHRHGQLPFGALLEHPPALVARVAHAPAFARADVRGLAFVDTETTGLAGGVGTFAFLVGVGVFEAEAFVLRQYFMRGPHEEPALLTAVLADLAPRAGWVTFNGRAFDLPLLEARLKLNQQSSPLRARPHLDLLTPARWLYRGRLASCALSSLERHVLGVPRTADDVPGELIPAMYQHYVRTGETGDMRRVIYHNAMDILSMVTLAAHLLEVFATEVADPPAAVPALAAGGRDPAEVLRLAHWHDRAERPAEAEAAYRQALAGPLTLEDRQTALLRLAALLKRLNRRAEAVPLWEQLASFTVDDALPCVELSKYYEWKAGDLPQALAWARRAEKLIKGLPAGWRQAEAQTAIARRLERLAGKLAAPGAG
ncbi:MAG: ribonuclease H-like domain-containing protein [Anaerolineales bacterium]|nr:ribonuclease H-like domain-containing protein [Anaerolineales bacterium]